MLLLCKSTILSLETVSSRETVFIIIIIIIVHSHTGNTGHTGNLKEFFVYLSWSFGCCVGRRDKSDSEK